MRGFRGSRSAQNAINSRFGNQKNHQHPHANGNRHPHLRSVPTPHAPLPDWLKTPETKALEQEELKSEPLQKAPIQQRPTLVRNSSGHSSPLVQAAQAAFEPAKPAPVTAKKGRPLAAGGSRKKVATSSAKPAPTRKRTSVRSSTSTRKKSRNSVA